MTTIAPYEHVRTELLPTVIFDGVPELDQHPYINRHGRPIPGPTYSQRELNELLGLVADVDRLPFTPLPTAHQLGRITLNGDSGCWELPLYNDRKNRARYGSLMVNGIPNPGHLAHRTMFMVFYGVDSPAIKLGNFLDHLCENKACCYPRHLESVPPGTNTRRARLHIGAGHLSLAEQFLAAEASA